MQTRTTKEPGTASDVFHFGTAQSQAILDAQKQFLDAIDRSSRAWLDRVKSEAELWSELSTKLAQTRSMDETFDAYQHFISQRIQMAADDGHPNGRRRWASPF